MGNNNFKCDDPDVVWQRDTYTKEEIKFKGEKLSDCMLGNYGGTIIGLTVGVALGVRKKHLRPFLTAITLGTFADIFYGYCGNCSDRLEDFNRAKEIFEKQKKEGLNEGGSSDGSAFKIESPFDPKK